MRERSSYAGGRSPQGATLAHSRERALLDDMDKVPADWEGFELRWWLADKAKEYFAVLPADSTEARTRRRNYANERTVRSL